jgi:hypothetical protein
MKTTWMAAVRLPEVVVSIYWTWAEWALAENPVAAVAVARYVL